MTRLSGIQLLCYLLSNALGWRTLPCDASYSLVKGFLLKCIKPRHYLYLYGCRWHQVANPVMDRLQRSPAHCQLETTEGTGIAQHGSIWPHRPAELLLATALHA